MTIRSEYYELAKKLGYTGSEPSTTAAAIDALADTLAGSDVDSGRTIAEAVRALAPYVGAGGGTGRVELFNETVTTVDEGGGYGEADLAYTGDLTADPLVVAFDGTEYELPRSETEDMMDTFVNYGAPFTDEDLPDFSTYPLRIGSGLGGGWRVITETAGTHTIVAYADSATPTPTLGALQVMPILTTHPLMVGEQLSESSLDVCELYVGSQIVLGDSHGYLTEIDDITDVAAGTTVVIKQDRLDEVVSFDTFLVTLDSNDGSIVTFERFLNINVSIDVERGTASWVMPVWNATEQQVPVMYLNIGLA